MTKEYSDMMKDIVNSVDEHLQSILNDFDDMNHKLSEQVSQVVDEKNVEDK